MISKTETVRQKLGITNQNQNREVITNPQQHENVAKKKEMMTVSQVQWVNHHPKVVPTEYDAQLIELRVEEHHEERVGTNII